MQGINLLPWREERREERRRGFFVLIGSSVMLALLTVIFVHTFIARRISQQQRINHHLQSEVNLLNRQLREIKDLKAKRRQVMQRMQLIHALQASRPLTVKFYDELVRIVPPGIYLQSIKREGNKVTLVGRAESNTRVSDLMRNIQKSSWFNSPLLSEIKTMPDTDAHYPRHFILKMQLVSQIATLQHRD